MELVKEVRTPKRINPAVSMIYAHPKVGKTTIVSGLEDHLIIELETNGADYITGRVQEVTRASEFNEVLTAIETSEEKVCEYLIVDSCTKLDEWSEIVGTYKYMNQTAGKGFNRVGTGTARKILHYTDPQFESVHSLGQGYGYRHSRDAMLDWYDRLTNLVALGKVGHVILLAHVKDKIVEGKTGDAVETSDISLTGKVKNIYSSRVDAIANFVREDGKGYLNFDNEYKAVCGGRCAHLSGKILVSEKQEDKSVKTFWENIYIK